MVLVCEETTKWSTSYGVNHVYFLNKTKSKMYAYINAITGESKIFSKPMAFSAKDRTFELIAKYDV